jgi:hypothetical protein
MASLLKKLKKQSPTEFENLVFDLMVLSGLHNATWRTPGADGGRDIEGEAQASDLSGTVHLQKWYVECKRYEHTLDWPSVFAKIAYADNHGADYLLICTTATLSPRCKEEVARRELRRERPIVRAWDGPILENRVSREPVLLAKYNLEIRGTRPTESVLPLVKLAVKSVQSAYGAASYRGVTPRELEFAAALVELLSSRLDSIEMGVRITHHKFIEERDAYEWCKIDDRIDFSGHDAYTIRAMLSAIRFIAKKVDRINVTKHSSKDVLMSTEPPNTLDKVVDTLAVIVLFSNHEFEILNKSSVILKVRR